MNEFDLDFKAFLRRHRDWSLKVTAVLLHCDRPTRNGHIYPRELMEREIARLAANNTFLGYLPHEGLTALEHVAFTVERPHVVHDSVEGTIKFLDTDAGHKLRLFMEAGGKVSFSAEGTGRTDGHGVVQNDFRLHGLIASPHAPLP